MQYKIHYTGNNTYAMIKASALMPIEAETPAEATEKFYQNYFDRNCFKEEETGNIYDSSGDIVRLGDDERIQYDGGYFYATPTTTI